MGTFFSARASDCDLLLSEITNVRAEFRRKFSALGAAAFDKEWREYYLGIGETIKVAGKYYVAEDFIGFGRAGTIHLLKDSAGELFGLKRVKPSRIKDTNEDVLRMVDMQKVGISTLTYENVDQEKGIYLFRYSPAIPMGHLLKNWERLGFSKTGFDEIQKQVIEMQVQVDRYCEAKHIPRIILQYPNLVYDITAKRVVLVDLHQA